MSQEDHCQIIHHTFYGTEVLETTVNDRSDFHVRQLASEKMYLEVWQLSLKEATFEFRTLNTPLCIWGDKNSHHLVFEFILSPILGRYLCHGFEMTADTLYGFDNSRGIDLVLPAGLLMGILLIKKEVSGPLLFGGISAVTGNQRLAVVAIAIFLGLGGMMLSQVRFYRDPGF
jgi:hypothetical protein